MGDVTSARKLLLVFHCVFQLLGNLHSTIVKILLVGAACPDDLTILTQKRCRNRLQFLAVGVKQETAVSVSGFFLRDGGSLHRVVCILWCTHYLERQPFLGSTAGSVGYPSIWYLGQSRLAAEFAVNVRVEHR